MHFQQMLRKVDIVNLRMITLPLWLAVLLTVACSPAPVGTEGDRSETDHSSHPNALMLPDLQNASTERRPIRVVATTGIVGDVVSAVAGESAEVIVLMAANQDPHGYQSTAGDLQQVANADVVFVNGWDLEEGLIADLENAAGDTPIVPVSAGIEAKLSDDSDVGHIDSHVWLAPSNVVQWVENIEVVLSSLDPENSEAYGKQSNTYKERLEELDAYSQEQLLPIDAGRRLLVTNHDAFGHFANAYGFDVVGTIVPGNSTLAEPASRDLATLVERMREASVCSLFIERSSSRQLAEQLAGDLDHCTEVRIVSLYSGALGEEGSGAETYLEMMKTNIDLIVGALGPADTSSNGG